MRHSLNILLVDDDPLVVVTISEMLKNLGHKVTEAHSASEALHLFQSQTFELAVIDYAMPGMTGAELIYRLTELGSALPCILITSYSVLPVGLPENIFSLNKPFSEETLAEAISSIQQHQYVAIATDGGVDNPPKD